MKVFYRKDGTASQFPLSKAAAKRLRTKKYETDYNGCVHCAAYAEGTGQGKLRYTRNDRCALCAHIDSFDFYGVVTGQTTADQSGLVSRSSRGGTRRLSPEGLAMAREAERLLPMYGLPATSPATASASGSDYYVRPEPCVTCGGLGLRHIEHGCHWCHTRKGKESPRQKAIAAGESWYTPDEDCPSCLTRAPRSVHNGRCSKCCGVSPRRESPRQKAIAAGESWYTPDKPCKRCGTTAPRSVHNGQCKGCKPATDAPSGPDGRETPSSRLMRECPELVMSKEDARGFGFTVYRTGKACRNGHKGYRYVSTGGCVECLRGR